MAELSEHSQSCNLTQAKQLKHGDNFCELNSLEGGIYIINFTGESHHRFSLAAIRLIDGLLDQVRRDASACALITTNQGKFFSNGMDVDYLRETDRGGGIEYLQTFHRLVSKLLTYPLPTIAIVRGHAVGAGCVFALAHDYRLMTSNRGYMFMNEIDLGMSMTPGIVSVLRTKLPASTFQEVVITGKRYDGKSAVEAGIVHKTCLPGPSILQEGIKKAQEYKYRKWKREVYQALKMEMFKTTVRELEHEGIGFARM